MPDFDITLESFAFPDDLDDDKADFRLVVEVCFSRSRSNDGEELVVARAVLPSLDAFWECDKGRKNKVNYVRALDNEGNALPSINMEDIAKPDRLLRVVNATKFHFIRVTVLDVKRKSAWDKVKDVLGGIVGATVSILTRNMSSTVTRIDGVETEHEPRKAYGEFADDLQSMLMTKAAGGEDEHTLLFQRSAIIEKNPPTTIEKYGYNVKFKIEAAAAGVYPSAMPTTTSRTAGSKPTKKNPGKA